MRWLHDRSKRRVVVSVGAVALLCLTSGGIGHAEPDATPSAQPTTGAESPEPETPAEPGSPVDTTEVAAPTTTTPAPSTSPTETRGEGTLNVVTMREPDGEPIRGVPVSVGNGVDVFQVVTPATITVPASADGYYAFVLEAPPGYIVGHEPGPIVIDDGGGATAQLTLIPIADAPHTPSADVTAPPAPVSERNPAVRVPISSIPSGPVSHP